MLIFKPFSYFQQHCKLILLTFFYLLIIKMYNSEQVYTFEENRENQTHPSHPSSLEEHRNNRISNSRPKNAMMLGPKANLISGTYARIVPKKPIHDMERLYAENMQLRQKIQVLEENSTKIKTRLTMAQKQKQQLINQFCHSQYSNGGLRDRRPSQKGLIKNYQKSSKPQNEQNRRILNGYKDQIEKLKTQNAKLKKTVKYTQIQQLETENRYLHQQIVRVKNYAKDIIQNTEYDDYERQIESLSKTIKQERDSKRSMQLQMKKKDQEMEQLKNKMKIVVNRKGELEKKYTREVNALKAELHKTKQREKQFFTSNSHDVKEANKMKNGAPQCKNCLSHKQSIQNQRKKIAELTQNTESKQKQLVELSKKLRELQATIAKNAQNSHQKATQNIQSKKKIQNKKQNSQLQLQQKNQAEPTPKKRQDKGAQPLPSNQKAQKPLKAEQKYDSEQYDQDSDYYEDEKNENAQSPNYQQSEDKIDVFHVNLQKQHDEDKVAIQNKLVEHGKNNSQQNDDIKKHAQQLKGNQSEQEVLFQKQKQKQSKADKSQSSKKKPKQQKQTQKRKQKQKQKDKVGGTKQQKILKETIKYRLIAQRYQYTDFQRDIKNSKVTEFSVDELINMLQNEPFFIQQEHLRIVLFTLFQRDQLDETDSVTVNTFLKKMKVLIGDFQLKSQQIEQEILKSIGNKLGKKKILQKLHSEAGGEDWISKKGFVQVLKQSGGLDDSQIQQCLAEASVLSTDIAHINYSQFLQKLGYSS